jgi:formylglycine-generating enzyme required for sulfatase activity
MKAPEQWASVCTLLGLLAGTAGAVEIETVTVGNSGNAGQISGSGGAPDIICGAVHYTFKIGKYEVTAGQYCEFLNAVAATDTYGLYIGNMWSDWVGCMIQQSGTPGCFTYNVDSGWSNRPVNFVSWDDAARFANWLHNGQPTGVQDLTTTEDGSYFLNGATTDEALLAVTRKPGAKWVIPSEDEWYKAAYHKNDGVTGNYWDYPTASDSVPSNDLIDPDPGNNATFFDNGYTIGSPFERTEVGAHENSESPYGTFDQGGNVREWNEALLYYVGWYRGLRGGAFNEPGSAMLATSRPVFSHPQPTEYGDIGFRVAYVPDSEGKCYS